MPALTILTSMISYHTTGKLMTKIDDVLQSAFAMHTALSKAYNLNEVSKPYFVDFPALHSAAVRHSIAKQLLLDNFELACYGFNYAKSGRYVKPMPGGRLVLTALDHYGKAFALSFECRRWLRWRCVLSLQRSVSNPNELEQACRELGFYIQHD